MKHPSLTDQVVMIAEDGLNTMETIPYPPDYVSINVPILPPDTRSLFFMVERRADDYTLDDLEYLDNDERKELKNIELRELYTEEQNYALSFALRCNTSVRIMGCGAVAKDKMFYTVKYICKNPVDTTELTNLTKAACVKTTKFPSKKEAHTVSQKEKNDN